MNIFCQFLVLEIAKYFKDDSLKKVARVTNASKPDLSLLCVLREISRTKNKYRNNPDFERRGELSGKPSVLIGPQRRDMTSLSPTCNPIAGSGINSHNLERSDWLTGLVLAYKTRALLAEKPFLQTTRNLCFQRSLLRTEISNSTNLFVQEKHQTSSW